jgi:hypothetical protein
MKRLWTVSSILGLAALALIPMAQAQPSAPRCNVFVSTLWANGPTPKLKVEAISDGPSCAKAVITFVVRDNTGKVLHNQSFISEFVATTSEARTPTQMRAALRNWIGIQGGLVTNASLPNWLAGATAPEGREFGFTPDESITRADYLTIRNGRAPILCYVQGIESLNCLVWRNNGLEPFGVQAFPG